MLELFPDGFEERDLADESTRRLHRRGRRGARSGRRSARVTADDVAAGWEDALARLPPAGAVGRVWVGPPWEEPPADAIAVVIDPGRAFGTGGHPTTRLCLELLSELEPGSLLDVGCGSGVLAIAAARLGFAPVTALDDDVAAVEATRAKRPANGVELDVRLRGRARRRAAGGGRRGRERLCSHRAGRLRLRPRDAFLIASGYLESDRPEPEGFAPADAAHRRRLGRRPFSARGVESRAVASFSVRFLGCKVSHADAQAIRERLLADGHAERGDGADVAVVNTCCVTHEAVRKSRHAAARAARTHRRVYVTGCGANLAADGVRRPAGQRRRRRAAQRGDARSRCRGRRRGRLRPGGRPPRPRARVRQGAGRLQLLVRVLRDPARPRRLAQPRGRGVCVRCAGASSRATARSSSPGSTSAATATARPATRSRG